MVQRFKSACTYTSIRTAGPSTINRPHELLTTPPPYQRSEGMPHIGPSASLCRCAIHSGSNSESWAFEAAESVGVAGLHTRFCT